MVLGTETAVRTLRKWNELVMASGNASRVDDARCGRLSTSPTVVPQNLGRNKWLTASNGKGDNHTYDCRANDDKLSVVSSTEDKMAGSSADGPAGTLVMRCGGPPRVES